MRNLALQGMEFYQLQAIRLASPILNCEMIARL